MMQLIVLGKIPGTNLQLSFELIANVFAVIIVLMLIRSYVHVHLSKKHSSSIKPANRRSVFKFSNLVPHSF